MKSKSAREIKLFVQASGFIPFEDWYKSLRDVTTRRIILAAITRLADRNYKNFKSVGNGVQELRIFYGPGYRVYFILKGDTLVILLGGGDKNSQRRDINEAQKLCKEYKDETN